MIIYAQIRQVCGHELRKTGNIMPYYASGSNSVLHEEVYACPCGSFTLRDAGWITMMPRSATVEEIDARIEILESEISLLKKERDQIQHGQPPVFAAGA